MTTQSNTTLQDAVTFKEYGELANTKLCVLSLRNGREHRSPWFSSRERAYKALAVIQRQGFEAIIYVD